MPKLGEQTGTRHTSARSVTVFATIIGKYTLISPPSSRAATLKHHLNVVTVMSLHVFDKFDKGLYCVGG